MSNNNETNAFVKNVHLKGFKSIKDLEVRLNNGLNIIIGPNGSGKTNFVEFLSTILKLNTNLKYEHSYFSNIILQNEEKYFELREVYEKKIDKESFDFEEKPDISLFHDSKEIPLISSIKANIALYDLIIKSIKIPFTTPKDFQTFMLFELGQINYGTGGFSFNILYYVFEHTINSIVRSLRESIEMTDSSIKELLKINTNLLENLNRFSPIKNLRLSDSLSFSYDETHIKINYLMLEFYVNNSWLSWSELSDGTKRIFHIIYEVTSSEGLILLEEPENGVHPDQLQLLLDFFKEQSKHKQIIITTHSPEVLNILEKDELDRIIVTRYEDGRGTQMHHLSEKKIKKAKAYMSAEGLALKDFWVHSNLEEFDEEEKD